LNSRVSGADILHWYVFEWRHGHISLTTGSAIDGASSAITIKRDQAATLSVAL
jgi:hypothetical protein